MPEIRKFITTPREPNRYLKREGDTMSGPLVLARDPILGLEAATKAYVDAHSGSSMVYPGAGIPLSTGSAWGTSITNNSANWNTAYGWGNHASAGYLTSSSSLDPSKVSQTASYRFVTDTEKGTWNGKQNALNGTGFVKISGTTISYDNSTYVPTSRTLTINGTALDLSTDRSWTISSYSLPTASASVLGGIKVGTGLSIDAGTGVLSASGGLSGLTTNGILYATSSTAVASNTSLTFNPTTNYYDFQGGYLNTVNGLFGDFTFGWKLVNYGYAGIAIGANFCPTSNFVVGRDGYGDAGGIALGIASGNGAYMTSISINTPGAGYSTGDVTVINHINDNAVVHIDSVDAGGNATSMDSIIAAGNGYQVGDTPTISGGNGDATLYIDSVDTDNGNSVTGCHINSGGTGYTSGNYNTSGGSGSGLQVTITAAPIGVPTAISIVTATPNYPVGTYEVSGGSGGGLIVSVDSATPYPFHRAERGGCVAIGEDCDANSAKNIIIIGKNLAVTTAETFNVGFDELDFQVVKGGFIPLLASSAPTGPAEGQTYYDTTAHKMYTWDGSTWQAHW